VTKDVIYATSLAESETNFPFPERESSWALDIYAPVENGNWPTVLLIHGNGGTKEGYVRASEIISEGGAVVYTVDWPDSIADIAAQDNGRGFREISETLTCAIYYARATAEDFGGVSGRVTLVAHSYGSFYGAWIALAPDDLGAQWEAFRIESDGPPAQVACEKNSDSARVDAFIGIGGARYWHAEPLKDRNPALWEIASPFAYLGQKPELPIILLHGEQDDGANPERSLMFNDVLLEAGHDSRVILFDGGHIVPPELTFDAVTELASN
jgi:pimeloyl-ACP methyl ester carboxylesterase